MGCCGAKRAAEYKISLDSVEALIKSKPWDVKNLEKLDEAADKLSELNNDDRKDSEAHVRLKKMGAALTEEMVHLMDISLIMNKEVAKVSRIKDIAKVLDPVSPTSERVEQKHTEIQHRLATDKLARVKAGLAQLQDPAGLPEGSKRILRALQEAVDIVAVVPALAPDLLSQADSLAKKILDKLSALLEVDPEKLAEMVRIAEDLDTLSSKFAAKFGKPWLPVADRVQGSVFPVKLANAEALLEGDYDATDLNKEIHDLSLVWVAQPEEVVERLLKVMVASREYVSTSFEEALDSGEIQKMDKLVTIAEGLDELQDKLTSSGSSIEQQKQSQDLRKQRAGVTLTTLLTNADHNVKKQAQALQEAYKESSRKVKEIRAEKLKEMAEDAKWRFKLGSGGFKMYDEDKSAEVEQHYQAWVAKGKPSTAAERRAKITITVGPGGRSTTRPPSARSLPTQSTCSTRRPKCQYGAGCYRKNANHREDFSHPGDQDWVEENGVVSLGDNSPVPPLDSKPSSEIPGILSTASFTSRAEDYSLDFQTMTQMNLTRSRGMRSIQRVEGMTYAQKYTHEYFSKIKQFALEAENIFAQAESELQNLGAEDRERMQKQLSVLTQAMKPSLVEFLNVAVIIQDMKVIDDVTTTLGAHAELLDLKSSLRELRLQDVLAGLRQAFPSKKDLTRGADHGLWQSVQMGCQKQKKGNFLVRCKPLVIKEAHDRQMVSRRHVQMRCQLVLGEYKGDDAFGVQFRSSAGEVLAAAAEQAATHGLFDELQDVMRVAAGWQCSMEPFKQSATTSLTTALEGACRSEYQRLRRATELMQAESAISKVAQMPEICDLAGFVPKLAEKAFHEAKNPKLRPREKLKPGEEDVNSVKQAVELYKEFRSAELKSAFVKEFWEVYKPWYEEPSGKQDSIEWAVAFCEQLDMKVPKWMMNHDQLAALTKLEEAMNSGVEKAVREALIFAKQTDYKGHKDLAEKYDISINKLRDMKQLPPGWEVEDLVGTDAKDKMFGKVDLVDATLKAKFQKLFDSTRQSIVTRDRKGGMPKGYTVEKIVEVRNAESWDSYSKRKGEIIPACKLRKGAPLSDETWRSWSGHIATTSVGPEILKAANLPELQAEANECLMFHGTNPAAADSIAHNHFDMGFACKSGLFGAGLYFAESSSKSDEYVSPDKDELYPVLICRVTLGRINYMDQVDPTSDPGRDKTEAACKRGEFHSVLGDRKKVRGTYREFIVYDHYQVYPHFIVWYKRV